MHAIAVSVQETDGDRFDFFITQTRCHASHASFIKRQQDRAISRHTLDRLKAQRPRDKRFWPFQFQIILIEAMTKGEFQRVAETLRGNQSRTRATPFDNGIGGKCRAVNDEIKLGRSNIGFL